MPSLREWLASFRVRNPNEIQRECVEGARLRGELLGGLEIYVSACAKIADVGQWVDDNDNDKGYGNGNDNDNDSDDKFTTRRQRKSAAEYATQMLNSCGRL